MKDLCRPFWGAVALSTLMLFTLVRAGVGDLDSPEITASLADMGQMHPPGHPSYLGAASLGLWIPLGTLSFRVAFFSFLCLVFSAGILAELLVLHQSESKSSSDKGRTLLIPVTFGTLAVLVPGVAEQGIRPEVYAFHILLVVASLFGLTKLLKAKPDRRWVVTVGLLEGLALANHHYLTILSLGPATLWVLLRDPSGRWKRFAWANLGLFAGLLPYLSLALKDPLQSDLFWADTRSFTGFWDTVSAQAFQGSIGLTESGGFVANLSLAFGMLIRFLGIIPFVWGLIGLGLFLTKRTSTGLLLTLVLVGALISKAVMFSDPENPDDRGYLSVAFVLWALCGAHAFVYLSGVLQRSFSQMKVFSFLSVLCLATLGQSLYASNEMSEADPPSASLISILLEDVPASSLVLSHYYQNHFLLQYALWVEGRRPDLVEAHMSFGGPTGNGHRNHFRSRHPQFESVTDAYEQAGAFPLQELIGGGLEQAIALEPEPDFWGLVQMEDDSKLEHYFERSAPGFSFHFLSKTGARSRCGLPRRMATLKSMVREPKGLGLRSHLGYLFLERTLFQIRRGDARCARVDLDYLKELAGQGPLIEKLEGLQKRLQAEANQDGVVLSRPFRRLRLSDL